MNSEESLWEAIRSLWIKYCGVSDEYKMLRDRWMYLHKKESLHVLPHLTKVNDGNDKNTFDYLNDHVEKINQTFKTKLNFSRKLMETYEDSLHYLQRFSLKEYYILERKIFELSNFVGLLKLAFFQRTVSTEISHVASGLPHSPERTMGNELFYLAADSVAKSYYNCFKIPYGKWDEFITFSPPISSSHYPGALFRPSENTKLFHVSMSEEQKYFVGGYMHLAHEFGHGPLVELWRDCGYSQIQTPDWFKLLFNPIFITTESILRRVGGPQCKACPLNNLIRDENMFKLQVEQVVADVLGMLIGGPYVTHAYLDIAYGTSNELQLVRLLAQYSFAKKSGLTEDIMLGLGFRLHELEDKVEINRKDRDLEKCNNLSKCVEEVGGSWASLIHSFNMRYSADFSKQLDNSDNISNLLSLCAEAPIIDLDIISSSDWNTLEEVCEATGANEGEKRNCDCICVDCSSDTLFSHFITGPFDLGNIRKRDGQIVSLEEIKSDLSEGVPCPDVDPRYILHAYYEGYKDSKGTERPNYAATIHSLAFNKYIEID